MIKNGSERSKIDNKSILEKKAHNLLWEKLIGSLLLQVLFQICKQSLVLHEERQEVSRCQTLLA